MQLFRLYYLKKIFIVLVAVSNSICFAQIKPPNFEFKLEMLDPFLPNQSSKAQLDEKFGEPVAQFKEGAFQTYRYQVIDKLYRFNIIVQFYQNKVADFHASLPNYFLHDVFHQSLIARYGMQQHYLNVDEHSVYLWNKDKDLKIVYGSACTITCFPLYLSISLNGTKKPPGHKSLLERMRRNF